MQIYFKTRIVNFKVVNYGTGILIFRITYDASQSSKTGDTNI